MAAAAARTGSPLPVKELRVIVDDGERFVQRMLPVQMLRVRRCVCGITETTTCQEVIYALAHATSKTGEK